MAELRADTDRRCGAPTADGLLNAQRAWLRYRDAFIAFAAVKYPCVAARQPRRLAHPQPAGDDGPAVTPAQNKAGALRFIAINARFIDASAMRRACRAAGSRAARGSNDMSEGSKGNRNILLIAAAHPRRRHHRRRLSARRRAEARADRRPRGHHARPRRAQRHRRSRHLDDQLHRPGQRARRGPGRERPRRAHRHRLLPRRRLPRRGGDRRRRLGEPVLRHQPRREQRHRHPPDPAPHHRRDAGAARLCPAVRADPERRRDPGRLGDAIQLHPAEQRSSRR